MAILVCEENERTIDTFLGFSFETLVVVIMTVDDSMSFIARRQKHAWGEASEYVAAKSSLVLKFKIESTLRTIMVVADVPALTFSKMGVAALYHLPKLSKNCRSQHTLAKTGGDPL